ncbi:MAG: polysaccharide deacetylase family protein [Paenisporosarcina sp.]|nr:polysaccharide deacetylase family protein [Paenisporosarcina sp.]
MSDYRSKLLELMSVVQESDQSFLKVKLIAEDEVELLWEIDHETAESIKAITILDESYRYRISFHSSWDPINKQYKSFLTKTYRDQSEKINFICSKDYISGLSAIKSNEKVSHIKNLTHLPPKSKRLEPSETEKAKPYKRSNTLVWVVAAVMSFIFVIPFVYFYILNPNVTNHSLVKAENISNAAPTINNSDNARPSSSDTVIDTLPFVELKDSVSYNIPKGKVALTFDDGPTKYTKEITDVLKRHEVGGTFFFIGNNVKRYPDSVQYVHSNGYSIGSHSMSHVNFTNLTNEKKEYEILQTNTLIEDLIQEKVVLFRPPFGSKNEETIEVTNKTHSKMVLWNADTEDWKTHNANDILDYVVNTKSSGSIILLHESPAVIQALPKIIDYLKRKDLEIVNLK